MEVVQNLRLRQAAALLAHCTPYVGNDSGLMHLAAAVQTPLAAIFGPTIPHLRGNDSDPPVTAPVLTADVSAAVDVEGLAGHVGAVVAGQEDVAGSDLVRLAGAAHRRVRAELGDVLLRKRGRDQRRPDRTRRHGVDADASLDQRQRPASG